MGIKSRLQIIEQFAELLNFFEPFMIELFEMLQLPRDVEGDVDGPGSDSEGWSNVAFQGVAYHQQLVGQDT